MVKPTVYAIDPVQKKAQEKAKEAGQVEVPIQTNKLQDEFAVKTTQEGAKRGGCCASLGKWQKITICVVVGLLVIGSISFFTLRMLGVRCGNDDLEQGHRWEELEGDDGKPRGGFPRKDWDSSHESSEEDDLNDRPGGSSEHDGMHGSEHGGHHGGHHDSDEQHHHPDHHHPDHHHGPRPTPFDLDNDHPIDDEGI